MVLSGKYRRLYIGAILCFILINIAAIFFIFKRYNAENKTTQIISSTKFRFAKLKEKIESIRDSIYVSQDTLSLAAFDVIKRDEETLDSILVSDNFDSKSIEFLNQRIYELASKSNELEAEYKGDSNRNN